MLHRWILFYILIYNDIFIGLTFAAPKPNFTFYGPSHSSQIVQGATPDGVPIPCTVWHYSPNLNRDFKPCVPFYNGSVFFFLKLIRQLA